MVAIRSRALLAVACCAFAGTASARLIEEVVAVPVTVKNMYGQTASANMIVTLFREDTRPRPYPVAVLGHGRAGSGQERGNLGRARYPEHARWLTQLGFLVVVPTRVGYGETGGDDVEHAGPCDRRSYVPGFEAAADQMLAALAMARTRPDVDPDRAILMGQSYGGAAAIAVAARNPPGVQLVVSFAGGGGGDPVSSPQRPCSPVQLQRMFSQYGRVARVPSLWVYTQNDMYFGPRHARSWYDAFVDEGGKAEFVLFPPHGADGHKIFNEAPELWRPRVLDFLRANGYPGLREPK